MLKTFSSKFINYSRRTWKRKIATRPHVIYDDQTKSFLSVYPEVLETIMKSELFLKVPEYEKNFVDVIDYTVIKEKRFRPPLLLETYKILEKPKNITEESIHLANILAWCIELMHTYMNTSDDTMDRSEIRCDDLCWYKKENIGLTSFKDTMFIYESAYILLDKYFRDKPIYIPLINLIQEMNQRLVIGQSLDWHLKTNKIDFSKFNTKMYTLMSHNKGGFPVVMTPFQGGCILSNNYSKYLELKDLIQKLSDMSQVDNDVMDVFQNGKVKTNIGENIEEGQCSWLAVQVMEHGSEDVKQLFKENYGRRGSEYYNKIIDIYYEMDLFSKYNETRYKTLKYVNESISKLDDLPLQKAILNLYQNIFV